MSLIEEAKELFGEMRDATPEEQMFIDRYLQSISEPTGVNLFDFIEGEDLLSKKKEEECKKTRR